MKRLFIMLGLMLCFAMSSCFNGSKIQEQSVQEKETVMEDSISIEEVDSLMLYLIMSSYFNGSKIQEQSVQEEETVMEDTISIEEADTLYMDEQVTE